MASRAARGVALVTCMDTRIDPLGTFGLSPGEIKVVRNAGGRVTDDVLRSLLFAATFLDVTAVAVMHHTDCAVARLVPGDVFAALSDEQAAAARDWPLRTMGDPAVALEEDVEAVRACPALPPSLRVEGWRYDVATGSVDRVVTPSPRGA